MKKSIEFKSNNKKLIKISFYLMISLIFFIAVSSVTAAETNEIPSTNTTINTVTAAETNEIPNTNTTINPVNLTNSTGNNTSSEIED
ncbi:MAG: hypothetical protein ACP5C3_01180 [Methanomicrobiales archaeon]